MPDAPVVGLTTYRQSAAWGVWNTSADLLPTEYAAAVEAAGGVPVLLPPVAAPGAAARVVARTSTPAATALSRMPARRVGGPTATRGSWPC